jgi:Ca2+-binding EF-hand superfamily protein
VIDENHNGHIETKELRQVLNKLGYKFTPETVELFFKMVDEDSI